MVDGRLNVVLCFRACVFIFLIPFVFGIDVDMDCPDEIYALEEFECEVEVEDGEEKYDLKVEVDSERDSVLKIWNGEDFQSGYYYVKDFIRKSEDVKLKILEAGKYDIVVKLRDGDWRSEFDVGRIRVEEGEEASTDGSESEILGGSVSQDGSPSADGSLQNDGGLAENIISLGGDEVVLSDEGETVEDEWNYVSKDGKVIDWLPYLFCFFLIGLVGVMAWDRAERY